MRAWVIVVLLVVTGIVGGWVGYWVGHAFGWTTNAEWPLRIGGGGRAILLSMGLSFLSVMAGLWWLVVRPLRRDRRLLATGRRARATIRRVWRTGVRASLLGGPDSQLGFDLEVHPDGRDAYPAHATGMVRPAEVDAFAPGVEVSVRFDPSAPSHVVVESLVAPAPA